MFNYLSANNSVHLLSVVVVVVESVESDVNTIGKTTAKIKASSRKHPSRNSSIDDIDSQHGNAAHRDLNF